MSLLLDLGIMQCGMTHCHFKMKCLESISSKMLHLVEYFEVSIQGHTNARVDPCQKIDLKYCHNIPIKCHEF